VLQKYRQLLVKLQAAKFFTGSGNCCLREITGRRWQARLATRRRTDRPAARSSLGINNVKKIINKLKAYVIKAYVKM
jgi:hypothetical protein